MREESEREIRARIDATRARMGDTIEEIGDRVNPDRLKRELRTRAREEVDDFKHNVKQKARDTMHDAEHEVKERGRSLWETVKANPIPAGMVGVGLAWLVANGRSDDDVDEAYRRRTRRMSAGGYPYDPAYREHAGNRPGAMSRDYYGGDPAHLDPARLGYETGYMSARGEEPAGRGMGRGREGGREGTEHMGDRVREGAEHAADRVEHAADRVREGAHDAADAVKEKASELTHRASERMDDARHRVEDWADDAQDRVRRAEHRVEGAVRDHPMAAGMVAAALGFAAGLMIPESQTEHEMMGPTRDRVLDRAQDTVHRAADKAKDVAKETASKSAERAVDEMWSGGKGTERPPMTDPGR